MDGASVRVDYLNPQPSSGLSDGGLSIRMLNPQPSTLMD